MPLVPIDSDHLIVFVRKGSKDWNVLMWMSAKLAIFAKATATIQLALMSAIHVL